MKEKFNKISKEVNGTFKFTEKTQSSGVGVKDYQAIYSLDFEYDNEIILLRNYMGLKSYGTIESNLSSINNDLVFNIETKSPLNRLFSFSKEIYTISAKDKEVAEKITSDSAFNHLMDLASRTRFEPSIAGSLNEGKFNIRTEYHLLLPERQEILEPLIEFHKFLIDTLKNGIR